MKRTSSEFWKTLPSGFHRRRVGGRTCGFEAFVWRGDRPGLTLLLNGATHGDEYEGPTVLTEMARSWRPRNLRGAVIAVPVLNENAFLAGRRESPSDGKNLARVFPGKSTGSHTERLAHLFRTRVLQHVDLYMDFHSAGSVYEIEPWVGYCVVGDPRIMETQRKMARCFDRFWCWGSAYLPGRTISAAWEHCVPSIYSESHGRGDLLPRDVTDLRRGIERMLVAFGFLPGRVALKRHRVTRESTSKNEGYLQLDHPSPCDGLIMSLVKLGAHVKRGRVVAEVQPLDGRRSRIVRTVKTGRVVFVRRQRSIRKGEAIATVVPA